MSIETKVEITHKETIKPSSPTPNTLSTLKLSLLDQVAGTNYIQLVLFYSAKDGNKIDHHKNSQKLKASLSETLTHFYPFAGRLKDNFFIECNDQGAEFIEARIHCSLSEILKKPDPQAVSQFLPVAIESPEAASGKLLLVQATFFDCGGLAVGLLLTHKVADAATLNTFIKCWSTTAGESPVMTPAFIGSSILPPVDQLSIPQNLADTLQRKLVTKRFVFDASRIAGLRAKAASEKVPNPTRVEAVAGLIWNCLITSMRSNLKLFRPSVWAMAVNMRSRFDPQLPENYAGNSVGSIFSKIKDDNEIELKSLVGKIREEKENFGENFVKKVQGEEGLLAIYRWKEEFRNLAMSKEIEFYRCSSWCRFDLYGADF